MTAISKLVLVVVLQLGVLGWVMSDDQRGHRRGIGGLPRPSAESPPEFPVSSIRRQLHPAAHPHSASLWALNSLSRPAMAAVSSLEQVGLLSFRIDSVGGCWPHPLGDQRRPTASLLA